MLLELALGDGWSKAPLDEVLIRALDLSLEVGLSRWHVEHSLKKGQPLAFKLPPGRYRVWGLVPEDGPAERMDPLEVELPPGKASWYALPLVPCGLLEVVLELPPDACPPITVLVRSVDGTLAAERVCESDRSVKLRFDSLRQGAYSIEVHDTCGDMSFGKAVTVAGGFTQAKLHL